MRVLLFAMLIGGSLACENRLENLVQEAAGRATDLSTDVHGDCNSRVGTFLSSHAPQYKKVLNKALALSMKYMSISSHFGRDTIHRMGFKKLFRTASNERFQQAVDMIMYVVKRGGNIKGDLHVQMPRSRKYQPLPLPSLGIALSDAKDMYAEQERLHLAALCLRRTDDDDADNDCAIDADMAHKAQDAIGAEVERVNELASKANQLSAMFTGYEHSLAEHLYDQYMQ